MAGRIESRLADFASAMVLAILSGEGGGAIVQTVSYTYHVQVEGIGNLLRYCGPHDTPDHRDHKKTRQQLGRA